MFVLNGRCIKLAEEQRLREERQFLRWVLLYWPLATSVVNAMSLFSFLIGYSSVL